MHIFVLPPPIVLVNALCLTNLLAGEKNLSLSLFSLSLSSLSLSWSLEILWPKEGLQRGENSTIATCLPVQ